MSELGVCRLYVLVVLLHIVIMSRDDVRRRIEL